MPEPIQNMKKLKFHKKKVTTRDKQEYYIYLKSAVWREKRKSAMEFYGYNCGLCGSRHNLEVHHRNYRNIFKENMEDLMLLCETCHRLYHRKKIMKNGKESRYMKNPKYDTQPTTYYPKRSASKS